MKYVTLFFLFFIIFILTTACTKTEYHERLSYSMSDNNTGNIWYYSCDMDATVNLSNKTATITLSKFEPDWSIGKITFENMAREIISRDHPDVVFNPVIKKP